VAQSQTSRPTRVKGRSVAGPDAAAAFAFCRLLKSIVAAWNRTFAFRHAVTVTAINTSGWTDTRNAAGRAECRDVIGQKQRSRATAARIVTLRFYKSRSTRRRSVSPRCSLVQIASIEPSRSIYLILHKGSLDVCFAHTTITFRLCSFPNILVSATSTSEIWSRSLFQLLNEMKNGEQNGATSGPSLETVIAGLRISDEERQRLMAAMTQASGQAHSAKRVEEFRKSLSRVKELVPELAPLTVPWKVLKEIYDVCLAMNLPNARNLHDLIDRLSGRGGAAALSALEMSNARSELPRCGLDDIALITNFPIVSCAYGYTRGSSYSNEDHVLRAFAKRPSVTGGSSDRTPLYALSTGTEALVMRVSPSAMMRYLEANGFIANSEQPEDDATRRAWVLRQFMDDNRASNPAAYAMFAAVHSYAHRMIEQLALESCFSTTSLSEMVLPAALGFIIYVNQRSEFNIGGLSSFIEQRLSRALAAVVQPTPCMFDPICTMKDGGACNGCLYLPEVTCREFNAGLTRSVLHGGDILAQHELAPIVGARRFVGFFEAISRS